MIEYSKAVSKCIDNILSNTLNQKHIKNDEFANTAMKLFGATIDYIVQTAAAKYRKISKPISVIFSFIINASLVNT